MKEVFLVFIGGGIGSTLRYILAMLWQHLSLHPRLAESSMPWATLMANITGCLLISIFYNYSERMGLSYEARLMLTTGLCGGLTTFSTFSYEILTLMRHGYWQTVIAYFLLSICLGVAVAAIPFLLKETR